MHVDDKRAATGAASGAGLTMTLDRRYEHARVLRLRGVLTGESAAAVRDAVIAQLALVPAVVVLDLTGSRSSIGAAQRACGAWRSVPRGRTSTCGSSHPGRRGCTCPPAG